MAKNTPLYIKKNLTKMKQQTIFTTRNTIKYFTNVALDDGRSVNIRFEPQLYVGTLGNSRFATADAQVVAALKKHPYFNTTFFVETEPKQVVPSYNPDTTVVDGVKNTQAAKEWLETNKGHHFDGVPKKEDVLSAAAGYNVKFAEWK